MFLGNILTLINMSSNIVLTKKIFVKLIFLFIIIHIYKIQWYLKYSWALNIVKYDIKLLFMSACVEAIIANDTLFAYLRHKKMIKENTTIVQI